MNFNLRSLYGVMLLVGISAVSIFSIVGFLSNAYADNATMGANMTMNANVNSSTTMTGNTNMTNNTNMTSNSNMTKSMNATMTGNTNMTNTGVPSVPKILSPLQQFKSGVAAKSVQCHGGFTLIIKAEDGSPACVSSQIAQTLVARGWGTMS